MRIGPVVAALAVVVAAAAPATQAAPRATVVAKPSRFGAILFDGRGYVLYAFTRDPRGRSVCRGACARAWPPYVVETRPRAGTGVAARRLGTTRRGDGSLQVTYAGRPLYYYVGDGVGEVKCQDVTEFGGTWLIVRPSGRL